jgi:hypothetical protein
VGVDAVILVGMTWFDTTMTVLPADHSKMLLEEGCGKVIAPILLSLKLVETFNFMERNVFYVKDQDIIKIFCFLCEGLRYYQIFHGY